ncbi:MAG TPA: hypothetical protein VJ455_06760 [Ignavibacteria bacterium]|nr:hypothetical protein [Ignavibacteria bacterium]
MNNIIETRIIPSKVQNGIISRKKLIKKLEDNINKSLIIICAPAGYGKTTLIQEYLEINKKNTCWLHVHDEMTDFYTFITYLTLCVNKLNKQFGSILLNIIEDYRKKEAQGLNRKKIITDVSSIFLNEIYKNFGDDIIIAIDELGYIEKTDWLNLTFQEIFKNIPDNLHFIITSRQKPDINTAALEAKRKIVKIDESELEFSTDEIFELIEKVYLLKCSQKGVNLLNTLTGGWITGLHLILQSHDKDFPDNNLEKLIITENIFNYFTEDIFDSLGNEIKDFLLNTAMLDSFSAGLCDGLLHKKNSLKIINELISKNIFIREEPFSDQNSEKFFRYQSLFKNYLESKLKELKNEKDIRRLYKKIAEYYLSINDNDRAVSFFLKSDNRETAYSIIKKSFQEYFDSGKFGILWKWLEIAGEENITRDPYLLFYKALMLRFYKGKPAETVSYIDMALKLAIKQNDQGLIIKCYITKFRNMINAGKIDEVIKNIKSISNDKIKKENNSKLFLLLALSYFLNSDYDNSIKWLDESLSYFEDSSGKINVDIYNLYGHIYLIQGEYSKSAIYYEQVARQSARITDKFEACCNLILLYSQSGKFDKAKNLINKVKDISDNIPIPIYRISYLSACQSFSFELGDFYECIKLLNEINGLAFEINHKYYIYLSYSLLGDCYYYLNNLQQAEDYYDLAFKYINENNSYEKLQYSVTKALLIKKSTMDPSLNNILLDAYEYYSKNKFVYDKTQTTMHLADYYLKTGNHISALKYLTEAITACDNKEYNSFCQREIFDIRYLFDFAIANNIGKDYIKMQAANIQDKSDIMNFSEEGKERAAELNKTLPDISLNAFGKGEICVRGEIIDDKLWVKKKFKHIFIYMLLSPRKQVSKDRILDLFFGDTQIEAADNIFHQAVSKIRNLIKIKNVQLVNSRKGSANIELLTSLILYEEKALKLNPDMMFKIDCLELEEIYKSIRKSDDFAGKVKLLEKGVNLFTGEFLESNYETWIEELRTKYKSYFIAISEVLVKTLYGDNNFDDTIYYAENLMKHDRFNLLALEYLFMSLQKLGKIKLAKSKLELMNIQYEKEHGEYLPRKFIEKILPLLA